MPDDTILRQLGAEMKRIILEPAAPGEYVAIPPSLEDGTGVAALLELWYGSAGEAETMRAIGLEANLLSPYSVILMDAAKALNLTEADLQSLHRMNDSHSLRAGPIIL
jgi:hypothetical protein